MQSNTKRKILILICGILVLVVGALYYRIINAPITIEYTDSSVYYWSNYSDRILKKYKEMVGNNEFYKSDIIHDRSTLDRFIEENELDELMDHDFDHYNYIFVIFSIKYGSVNINNKLTPLNKRIDFTIDIYDESEGYCVLPNDSVNSYYKIFELQLPKDIEEINISANKNVIKCYNNWSVKDKPIIYIYPEKDMDLVVKLGHDNLITHSYPKYDDEWNIHVDTTGNIYDYKTNRNYYALYWEGLDKTPLDMSEGFVVKGEDTTKFLEEKLELLGLNEKEIEEFIIYWLPRLEDNKYNFIRFRTLEEINSYMPLEFSEEPDTLIRIMADFKPLNKKIKVKEQTLQRVERNGFTIVEWGGRIN